MTDQLPLFTDPGDAPARAAIASELDANLFVEAGAGTGKTAALVARVVALVTSDGPDLPMPVRSIAAITFTEKAAAELRDRIRHELQERATDPQSSETVRQRCTIALDELDGAAICTLHAFAQRILTEFPIETGLPPRIEVRDEISSRVAFEARWRDLVNVLLDDEDLEPAVLVVLAAGVRLEHLRAVAEVLDDNWDLLDRVGAAPELPALAIGPWFAELDAVCALASECRLEGDKLLDRLGELAEYGARVRNAFDDVDRIRLLRADKPSFKVTNTGRKDNWREINAVRDRVARLGEARDAMIGVVLDAAVKRLVAALARGTAEVVEARRRAGELEFHDLLVLARTLLRDPRHGPRARVRLRERYRRVLIDEFQDTDPIQVELAVLLGTGDPGAAEQPWADAELDPGRVFFVGDPKQSIYRFRRADIATFLTASQRFAQGGPRFLSCNFRTAPAVLTWINHVFAELIRPHPGSQPEYRALDAARVVEPAHDRGVVLLGVEPHASNADAETLRRFEAADVAAAVEEIVTEGRPVFDRALETWRPAQLGDICILLPARTSLGFLERALDDASIPYRAETSSLVYGSREIRDVLTTLRAVDDPSDELALVSALRSSVFGCGDDDLFTYHVQYGGRWDVTVEPPDSVPADHPVRDAMQFLRSLYEARVWSTPSELLERIVRERHVVEVGALHGRFRDVARRMRFVIDQARAFADAAGGTVRDYLAWAALQGTEGARVVEAVLPETDDDAVRILTIHGAKGLEFPIVICSGTTTAAQSATRGVQVLFPPAGGCEVKLSRGVQTAHFELHQPVDEQMGFHEKLRLLYVACTRARDHLVVSVHRKDRDLEKVEPTKRTHAELLWGAAQDTPWTAFVPEVADDDGRARPAPRTALDHVPMEPGAWHAEMERARTAGRRRGFVAPTALAHRLDAKAATDPGLAKEPRDLELPPWNKGRYGTAIGRAVHACLQTVDLATGAGVDETAAAQAAAEGVLGHEATIAALVRAAIDSAIVRRAASRSHWREIYVAVPVGGITVEGYVDLLFRDDDGLVVVDYKTDAVDDVTRAQRILHYRVQAAAYALAVARATGERVTRTVLCFLTPGGSTEVAFEGPDLEAALVDVRALVAAEVADPSPPPALVPADF